MVRSFTADPIDSEQLDALLSYALGGPSAGNARSLHLVVLLGSATEHYWTATLVEAERSRFPWPGLLRAPALVLAYVEPAAYLARYSEADKAGAGLGEAEIDWPVPYWWVDGGAAIENLLLGATAHGLGACLFGQFDHEDAVRIVFGVPDSMRAVGTIAIGHPDPSDDRSSGSGLRGRADPGEHVHRGAW